VTTLDYFPLHFVDGQRFPFGIFETPIPIAIRIGKIDLIGGGFDHLPGALTKVVCAQLKLWRVAELKVRNLSCPLQ
jgi:hypothetical protein